MTHEDINPAVGLLLQDVGTKLGGRMGRLPSSFHSSGRPVKLTDGASGEWADGQCCSRVPWIR